MGKRLNISVGDRFGRFTIIQESEKRNKKRYFLCECECGNEKNIRLDGLRNGQTTSCGCYNVEVSKIANTKHGMHGSRIYRIWYAMRSRCFSINSTSYANYGGRGITICDEWRGFDSFHEWATKNGYDEHLTIERKNVNGNYEPSNCTWITMTEQKRNARVTKRINFDGKVMTLRQWAKHIGISSSALCNRFDKGWTLEKALTTPSQKKFIRSDFKDSQHV